MLFNPMKYKNKKEEILPLSCFNLQPLDESIYSYNENQFQNNFVYSTNNIHHNSGENSSTAKYTDKQVHILCKGLSEGKSYENCLSEAGLEINEANRKNISKIASGKTWLHISDQYDIGDRIKKKTDYSEYIIKVCELLQKGYSPAAVMIRLEIKDGNKDAIISFIKKIKYRKSYTDISKDYEWEGNKNV